jgi:hypothetical protein
MQSRLRHVVVNGSANGMIGCGRMPHIGKLASIRLDVDQFAGPEDVIVSARP